MNPLEKAAELLGQPGGWTTGSMKKRVFDEDRRRWRNAYCLVGSLWHVTGEQKALLARAQLLVRDVLIAQHYIDEDDYTAYEAEDACVYFNDDVADKSDDVVAVLQKAATHWDEPHDG